MRFRDMYRDVQIPCEILEEREIIKMCNLYSNRRSNSYDVNLTYSLRFHSSEDKKHMK